MAERPVVLHTEPVPDGPPGQLRLHHDDGPAIGFADGYGRFVVHGTPVPAWVVTGPTVEAIHREPNIRCGAPPSSASAGTPTSTRPASARSPSGRIPATPAPGSACTTCLLLPGPGRRDPARRQRLARAGRPDRQYVLTVPADIDDPVAAAAWTYGLTAAQYAQLARRT